VLAVAHRHTVDAREVPVLADLYPLFVVPVATIHDQPGVLAIVADLPYLVSPHVLAERGVAVEGLLVAGRGSVKWHMVLYYSSNRFVSLTTWSERYQEVAKARLSADLIAIRVLAGTGTGKTKE